MFRKRDYLIIHVFWCFGIQNWHRITIVRQDQVHPLWPVRSIGGMGGPSIGTPFTRFSPVLKSSRVNSLLLTDVIQVFKGFQDSCRFMSMVLVGNKNKEFVTGELTACNPWHILWHIISVLHLWSPRLWMISKNGLLDLLILNPLQKTYGFYGKNSMDWKNSNGFFSVLRPRA